MIYYINGDLLNTQCQYICHQVNCQGKMNSGVAKAIRDKWPVVYHNYMAKYNAAADMADEWAVRYEGSAPTASEILLGNIQIVGLWEDYYTTPIHQSVINIFAQQCYGYDGRRYTSYDAFWLCLGKIRETVPKGSSLAFPYKIGCVRGGANWTIIETMIKEALEKDYNIFIYKLEDNQ